MLLPCDLISTMARAHEGSTGRCPFYAKMGRTTLAIRAEMIATIIHEHHNLEETRSQTPLEEIMRKASAHPKEHPINEEKIIQMEMVIHEEEKSNGAVHTMARRRANTPGTMDLVFR